MNPVSSVEEEGVEEEKIPTPRPSSTYLDEKVGIPRSEDDVRK